jgi:hypothetical protein
MRDVDKLREAMQAERIAPHAARVKRRSPPHLPPSTRKPNRAAKDRVWSAVSGMRRMPLPKS